MISAQKIQYASRRPSRKNLRGSNQETLAATLSDLLYQSSAANVLNPNNLARQVTIIEEPHPVENRRCRQAQYFGYSILARHLSVVSYEFHLV